MKILKYILGIAFIPFAIGFSKSFYNEAANIGYMGGKLHFFLWGIVAYMLVHILLAKPVYLYTLGHESIHALSTWLCGGHITSFKISSEGGSITTSKSNFFIELSPYFVPIYTIMLFLLLPVVKNKFINPYVLSLYIFSVGFTVGMHLIMTAESLKSRQPDIKKSGYIFSLVVIYVGNLLVLFLILSFFSNLSFGAYFMKSLNFSKNIYLGLFNKLFRVF